MHIGIIADGNRRWAKAHDKSIKEGHAQRDIVLRKVLPRILKHADMVSIYLFSHRNWNRSKQEVVDLFEGFYDSVHEFTQPNVNLLINYKPTVQQYPDVDLVIRTGGRYSLSGFLPLESAFAELYVIDKYWPDFTTKDFDEALTWFKKQRRLKGS